MKGSRRDDMPGRAPQRVARARLVLRVFPYTWAGPVALALGLGTTAGALRTASAQAPAPNPAPLRVLKAEAGLFGPVGTEPGSFVAAPRLPLRDGQAFGWRLRLRTPLAEVQVEETLTLPAEPRTWGDPEPDILRRTTPDGRSAVSRYRKRVVDGQIWHSWTVTQGDPPGPWQFTLRVEQAPPVVLRLQAP
jgi:hypothetical protein